MRFRLVTVAILLVAASRVHGRPRVPDPLDGTSSSQEALAVNHGGGAPDSRHEQHRELKDIQHMDQSLRTVATQLLNATAKHDDMVRMPEEKIVTIETPMQVVHISTRVEDAVSDTGEGNKEELSNMKFGIPMNSKFGHFELSNPGHAMAMTEEEIEREMATATTTAQKHQPTTTSMLSTWIQLYPPSTTTDSNNEVSDDRSNQIQTTGGTKATSPTVKQSSASTKPMRKTETKTTTVSGERTTESTVQMSKVTKGSSPSPVTNFVKITTTLSSTSIENDVNNIVSLEKKTVSQRTTNTASSTTKTISTTKRSPSKSTTPKPKVTGQKNSTTKPPKNNGPLNKIKPFSTRRPSSNKNDSVTSTSKIEKVTIKPASVPAQNRTESTEKPLFITKIKASILTDTQKTTVSPVTMKPTQTILSKSNASDSSDTKSNPTRVNNILKVHTKKPVDDTTKIEIQPIRVNPPVLTIEKIGDSNSDQNTKTNINPVTLANSKIDVKFDFDSDTKIEVQTESSSLSPSTTSTTTTSTKRPRGSNKRKKNKRRRKPSTTTTISPISASTSSDDDALLDAVDVDDLQLIQGIQESKIEPESKAPPSKKKKPNQQTQVQKPIGTQIYNFLSREVMPSVGVMSLVGLGLGLASYFLYPFGGVIARRNYDVEPNYKYNLDEYGGNYGLSEEEVLSKVYSGMTGGQHHETKYGSAAIGEKNPNYYRYSPEPTFQPTRYPNLPTKNHNNRVIYRPIETTSYNVNYRNTEFKYPDVPTTPNYYERQRQQPVIGKVALGNNRQFVVGNIPKEYSSGEVESPSETLLPIQEKMDNDGLQYQISDVTSEPPIEPLASPAALASSAEVEQPATAGIYQEIEIAPTPMAIEHGPRSFPGIIRRKRGILPNIASSFIPIAIPSFKSSRMEKNSVIQVIPSKSEIEKEHQEEENEEDLSNEILDIIDETVHPGDHHKKRFDVKDHITLDKDSAKPSVKLSTTTITTTKGDQSTSSTSTSTTTAKKSVKDLSSSPSTSATTTTTTTTTSTTTTEKNPDSGETTVEWNVPDKSTEKPPSKGMDFISIAKKIAEFKLRIGLTILKHASEGFARYIGHVQKRFNGEE